MYKEKKSEKFNTVFFLVKRFSSNVYQGNFPKYMTTPDLLTATRAFGTGRLPAAMGM